MIPLILLLGWFLFCVTLLFWPGRTTQRSRLRLPESRADSSGDWGGAREPRRPNAPFWPPQAAAVVVPEESELQMPGSSVRLSTTPQQPLRLQDGLT